MRSVASGPPPPGASIVVRSTRVRRERAGVLSVRVITTTCRPSGVQTRSVICSSLVLDRALRVGLTANTWRRDCAPPTPRIQTVGIAEVWSVLDPPGVDDQRLGDVA